MDLKKEIAAVANLAKISREIAALLPSLPQPSYFDIAIDAIEALYRQTLPKDRLRLLRDLRDELAGIIVAAEVEAENECVDL